MATTKITDLTAYTDPVSTDVVPIVDVASDVTKKVSIADLMENAGSGTEALPGISFDGDPNTGIYRPGADQVAISTGGTGRLFVDASGNVGVGGAPNAQLNLIAPIPSFRLTDSDTSGHSQVLQSDTSLYVDADRGAAGTGALILRTNGTNERLRIDSSGRIGIGTSLPSAILDIANSTFQAVRTNLSSITDTFHQYRGTPDGAGYEHARVFSGRDTSVHTYGSFLAFYTEGKASGTTDTSVERLRIDSSGRVAIGSTSPSTTLSIGASASSSYNGGVCLNRGPSTYNFYEASDGTNSVIFGLDNNLAVAKIGSVNSYPIGFFTGNAERARIDGSGRLLVGTSTSATTALVQIRGNSAAPTNPGTLYLFPNYAAASLGTGDVLGRLQAGANDGSVGATIDFVADAQWGSSDYPTRLVFSTTADSASSPTERMRIANTGVISTFNSVGDSLNLFNANSAGTSYAFLYGLHSATNNVSGGTTSILIYTNGNVVNTNNSYGAISDIKLKENIVDANSQWDDIKALQVRKYNFKEGQTHTQIGLVAQEAELVSPGLVSESPDRDQDGNDLGTTTKSVNYSVLYMKAVKALQEAMERIETLEAKVAALEAN